MKIIFTRAPTSLPEITQDQGLKRAQKIAKILF